MDHDTFKALRPAVCACGHKGRSQRPEYYQCTFCYCTNVADSNDALVVKLRKRIKKLKAETADLRARAAKFRDKHRGCLPPRAGIGVRWCVAGRDLFGLVVAEVLPDEDYRDVVKRVREEHGRGAVRGATGAKVHGRDPRYVVKRVRSTSKPVYLLKFEHFFNSCQRWMGDGEDRHTDSG